MFTNDSTRKFTVICLIVGALIALQTTRSRGHEVHQTRTIASKNIK